MNDCDWLTSVPACSWTLTCSPSQATTVTVLLLCGASGFPLTPTEDHQFCITAELFDGVLCLFLSSWNKLRMRKDNIHNDLVWTFLLWKQINQLVTFTQSKAVRFFYCKIFSLDWQVKMSSSKNLQTTNALMNHT